MKKRIELVLPVQGSGIWMIAGGIACFCLGLVLRTLPIPAIVDCVLVGLQSMGIIGALLGLAEL